jgi:hypothetical protein
MLATERRHDGEVVLAEGLRNALARLHPTLPAETGTKDLTPSPI